MNEKDKKLEIDAINFARTNKSNIAEKILKDLHSSFEPFSYFMCGSPGAGKTEFSKNFLNNFSEDTEKTILRIDPDEFRLYFDNYQGHNSYIFQSAISIILDKVQDRVLKRNISFLMDGTFSNLHIARRNILRSLAKNRKIIIFYIYQKPDISWRFTQAREKIGGRKISEKAFVEGFINSRDNIKALKEEFLENIKIIFINKNFTSDSVNSVFELKTVENFEKNFEKWYNKDEIMSLIKRQSQYEKNI